jgi:hypothetical protein
MPKREVYPPVDERPIKPIPRTPEMHRQESELQRWLDREARNVARNAEELKLKPEGEVDPFFKEPGPNQALLPLPVPLQEVR